MDGFLPVEPDEIKAAALAGWLLGRDPGVRTVSAGGFLVSLDLYPDVPAHLLEGAYVDGFPVGQKTADKPQAAPEDGVRGAAPGKSTTPQKSTTPRKTARKRTAPRKTR